MFRLQGTTQFFRLAERVVSSAVEYCTPRTILQAAVRPSVLAGLLPGVSGEWLCVRCTYTCRVTWITAKAHFGCDYIVCAASNEAILLD